MSDSAWSEWFRNKTWSQSVEECFEHHLRRARRKDQYLRVQAYCLLEQHPQVSLKLIDRFFALDHPFVRAQGFEIRANALAKLGRLEDALVAYEQALLCEASLPTIKTNAYADMAEFIVVNEITTHYDRALSVLDIHAGQLAFPECRFVHHACRAVILQRRGNIAMAKAEARLASEQASRRHSGLPYHPDAGLVGEKHAPLLQLLGPCCDA